MVTSIWFTTSITSRISPAWLRLPAEHRRSRGGPRRKARYQCHGAIDTNVLACNGPDLFSPADGSKVATPDMTIGAVMRPNPVQLQMVHIIGTRAQDLANTAAVHNLVIRGTNAAVAW
jgi:hypothetical protein